MKEFAKQKSQKHETGQILSSWRWMQSPTNWSPRLNSLIYGNLQGIFYSLQGNGPETHQKRLPDPAVTMKFPTQRNREFLRAYLKEQGNGKRPSVHCWHACFCACRRRSVLTALFAKMDAGLASVTVRAFWRANHEAWRQSDLISESDRLMQLLFPKIHFCGTWKRRFLRFGFVSDEAARRRATAFGSYAQQLQQPTRRLPGVGGRSPGGATLMDGEQPRTPLGEQHEIFPLASMVKVRHRIALTD